MPVVKRTLSLDPEVFAQVEQAAAEERVAVSTQVNRMLEEMLALRRGLAAMQDYEREHGAFTAAELAKADRMLDTAGLGPGRQARRA